MSTQTSPAERRAAQALILKHKMKNVTPHQVASAAKEQGGLENLVSFLRRVYQGQTNSELTMSENVRAAAAAGN